MIKNIIFDMGNVLLDYNPDAAMQMLGITEKAKPVIMKELGITEILGICVSENIASIKVLEKVGFVKEFEGMGTYQDEEREICKYTYTLAD